jgi:hypothetical protein
MKGDTECERCGQAFQGVYRMSEGAVMSGHAKERVPVSVETLCKACEVFGDAYEIPSSPCCEEELRGCDDHYECQSCSALFSPRVIQALAVGLSMLKESQ